MDRMNVIATTGMFCYGNTQTLTITFPFLPVTNLEVTGTLALMLMNVHCTLHQVSVLLKFPPAKTLLVPTDVCAKPDSVMMVQEKIVLMSMNAWNTPIYANKGASTHLVHTNVLVIKDID